MAVLSTTGKRRAAVTTALPQPPRGRSTVKPADLDPDYDEGPDEEKPARGRRAERPQAESRSRGGSRRAVVREPESEPEPEEDDEGAIAERREELSKLDITELQAEAKAAGATNDKIKECGRGDAGCEALEDLIIELEFPDDEEADDDAPEEEPELPVRGRRSAGKPGAAAGRVSGRGRRVVEDDDEEDEKPVRAVRTSRTSRNEGGGRSASGSRSSTASAVGEDDIRSGWAGAQKNSKRGARYDRVELDDNADPVLISFIEDAPFGSYIRHWIDEAEGRKGFVCLTSIDNPDGTKRECPLDEIDSEPRSVTLFNVLVLNDDGQWELKVWEAGPSIVTKLENLHKSSKTGPLSENYYSVVKEAPKKKGRGFTNYKIDYVKGRDVQEDFDAPLLTDEDIEKFKKGAFDKTVILDEVVDERGLRKVRDEVLDED